MLSFELFEAVLRPDKKLVAKLREIFFSVRNMKKAKNSKDIVNLLNLKLKELKPYNFKLLIGKEPFKIIDKNHILTRVYYAAQFKKGIFLKVMEDFGDPFLKYNDDNFDKFVDTFLVMFEHELVHDLQYKQQTKKEEDAIYLYIKTKAEMGEINDENEDQIYLSNKFEIMAHAKESSSILLKSFNNDKNEIKKALSDPTKYSPKAFGDSFLRYYTIFAKDDSVLKRFLKYLYEYLEL